MSTTTTSLISLSYTEKTHTTFHTFFFNLGKYKKKMYELCLDNFFSYNKLVCLLGKIIIELDGKLLNENKTNNYV